MFVSLNNTFLFLEFLTMCILHWICLISLLGFFFWEGGVDGGGGEIIVQMIISDETQQIPWW